MTTHHIATHTTFLTQSGRLAVDSWHVFHQGMLSFNVHPPKHHRYITKMPMLRNSWSAVPLLRCWTSRVSPRTAQILKVAGHVIHTHSTGHSSPDQDALGPITATCQPDPWAPEYLAVHEQYRSSMHRTPIPLATIPHS